MAGELTASTPTLCTTLAAVKTHVETLVLAATTDFIQVIPNGLKGWIVFKVERAS